MFIEVTQRFSDLKNDKKIREVGDIYEVDEKRGQFLIYNGYAVRSKKPKKSVKE